MAVDRNRFGAEDLTLALRACIEQYRLVLSEKELLEKTLFGAVQVLTEVLSLVNPVAFGKSNRVRNYVSHIARRLSVTHSWEFEVAAMLCQLGCVTLTPETMESVHMGQVLSPEEQHRYNSHPVVARDLLTRIPRLEAVAEMIPGKTRLHPQPQAQTQSPPPASALKPSR